MKHTHNHHIQNEHRTITSINTIDITSFRTENSSGDEESKPKKEKAKTKDKKRKSLITLKDFKILNVPSCCSSSLIISLRDNRRPENSMHKN